MHPTLGRFAWRPFTRTATNAHRPDVFRECGASVASGSFLRLIIFPLGRCPAARPSADIPLRARGTFPLGKNTHGDATQSVGQPKAKSSLNRKFRFVVTL